MEVALIFLKDKLSDNNKIARFFIAVRGLDKECQGLQWISAVDNEPLY